jgi:transposase
VPYQLARQIVEVRATPTTIEIFRQSKRVASHVRTRKAYATVTNTEHRPASHRAHLDWRPSRMIQWAATVSPRTREVVETILAAFPHPEMGYRSCLGVICLGQRYTAARVEAAAERALTTGAVSYKSMDSIPRRSLDQQPLNLPPARPLPGHANIRGAAYFQ